MKGITLGNAIFVGYFPKKVEKKPNWLTNDNVKEICSVSECISKGPKDWINEWKHNGYGFYDSEKIANEIISKPKKGYDIFAYKLYPIKYNNGKVSICHVKGVIKKEIGNKYVFIGYDAVSKSISSYFECSPLSCNDGGKVFNVNEFCLIEDINYAHEVCKELSKGKWEPGPYYLFEVYRRELK